MSSDATMRSMAPPAARTRAPRLTVALLLFAALAAVPVAAGLLDDRFLTLFTTRLMIFALAALSLDLILGYGAMVSFGHAAYLGIGAYAVGILATHGVQDAFLQLLVAVAASAAFALVTGAISLKTRGVYFIMITLAFGQMAYFTASSLSAYGGDDGLTIWGRSTVFGSDVLENDTAFYYVVLAILAGAYALLRAVVASRFGRVLAGAKQSELRLQAIGLDPYPYRLVAFTLAGVIAGIAGALFANQAEFVSPAFMSWQRSGELIFMVVLGGMGTLTGAVLGAGVFLLLETLLAGLTQHWKLIFGPLLILIVLFVPGGLMGFLRRRGHG
jgi:branched-chain amino acid transport system permease protein